MLYQSNKDKLPAAEKMSAARTQLVINRSFVFYGTLAMRLKVIEDNEQKTAYTDGRVIGYNRDFIDNLTFNETLFLIAHEVSHVAHLHHARHKPHYNTMRFNRAADYSINGILTAAGFSMPGDGLLDHKYDGMHVEKIYNLLEQDPNDKDDDSRGQWGEVRPLPDKDETGQPIDKETEIEKIKTAITQAVQTAEKAGSLPANIARGIKDIITPPVNWKELLRRFMQATNKNDYSMRRPNRRFTPHGLYLPSLRGESLGEIILAIDTSGSIDNNLLSAFCNELQQISDELKPEKITLLYCDTQINGEPVYIMPGELIQPEPRGGGGTRFSPVFKWVDDNQTPPAVLIYFTDMACSDYPADAPSYPVLWANYGGDYYSNRAPFGEVINIESN